MNFDFTRPSAIFGFLLVVAQTILGVPAIAARLPDGVASALLGTIGIVLMQILPFATKKDTVARVVPSIPPPEVKP